MRWKAEYNGDSMEIVVAYFKAVFRIRVQRLRKTTKRLSHYNPQPGRDKSRIPSEYKPQRCRYLFGCCYGACSMHFTWKASKEELLGKPMLKLEDNIKMDL
jgi:hypothetical protein